jgi:outer membrane protein OmpA-like peptidoglycan-associated protein
MYFKKWKDFILNEETQQVNSDTSGQTKTITNANTSGQLDVKPMSDDELKNALVKWNTLYSQEFKFINDMPKSVKDTNTLDELKANIADEYKIKVDEGLKKFIEFLKNEKVSKSLTALDIIGYTSTTGSPEYNKSLSERRAKIVSNAIQSMIAQAKLPIKLKINEKGEGENPDYLLIINDQDLTPLKLGKNAPQINPDDLKKLENSKEERQKLNRRVRITLPNLNLPLETPKVIHDPEKLKDMPVVVKPETPEPKDLTFNWDSFILTKEGQSIIKIFCNDLKKYNDSVKEDDKKIKTFFISSHTMLGTGDGINEREDRKNQEHMLAILSSNRAQFIKDTIKKELLTLGVNKEFINSLNFTMYPTSYKMINDKRVFITFEKTEHMKKAEEIFKELSTTYKLPQVNGSLEDTEKYLNNEPLLKSLEKNIKASIVDGDEGEDAHWIPLELAYDELTGYNGFIKYDSFRKIVQEKIKKLIAKENKNNNTEYKMEDFFYTPK